MAFDISCIDVADYLECLEFENVSRATEKEFRFSCPYPLHVTGDETPSAYMNAETTAFFCHGCKTKGNAITVAAHVLKVDPLEAIRLLRQRYSPAGIVPGSRSMVEELRKIFTKPQSIQRSNRILPESVLDKYRFDWKEEWYEHNIGEGCHKAAEYMFKRGFTVKTLNEWQFGYDASSSRVTLPVRDEDGFIVGIKARAWDGRAPKYLNMRDRDNDVEPYLKNEIVFALDRAKTHKHLVVVEGEYNAIAMHALGYENTVAINGSYFGQRQMKLIRQFAEQVTLFFDSDPAGRDATLEVGDALRPYVAVRVAPEHDGDPADMHPYTVRRCLESARPIREILLMRS